MHIINVLIADDHKLIIDGIKAILNDVPYINIVGEAENGLDLIEKAKELKPDIILTDIEMPKLNGVDAVHKIHDILPEIKVIVLTMHLDKSLFIRMKSLGAVGYIHKNIEKDELLHAINQVLSNKEYTNIDFFKDNESASIPIISPKVELTTRETEIIRLIAQGLTNSEIGDKLYISKRTVDTHRTNLLKKLNVSNVAGLFRYAFNNDLI
jgi:DNA-binding NarL/FixJ family response regulator